jgi:uncharacterized membrane protein
VIARSESWSRPADRQRVVVLGVLAVALFLGAWALLHHGFYTRDQVPDTPIYQRYGDAMANGQVPYRDFGVEYPPAALPVFVLPALGHARGSDFPAYRRRFETLMALCGIAVLVLVALILHSLGADGRRLAGALVFVALAPLLAGSVVLSRFDLWPVALMAGALAALVAGRERLGLGALAVAVAAKIYPGLLLVPALAFVARRLGRREALVCAGVFAAVLATCFVPFLALSPGGVWSSIVHQANRPLQIESLGAGFLLAAHQAFGAGITMRSSHGSQNLVGTAPDVLAALQTVLQVLVVVGIWFAFARGRNNRERLVQTSAAAICAFVALGKVLSPQFLLWLVPLVPLVRGRRGVLASALLGAALVLTQRWFPYRYWDLALRFDPLASWLVLARDLTLLALLAVLASTLRVGVGSERLSRPKSAATRS